MAPPYCRASTYNLPQIPYRGASSCDILVGMRPIGTHAMRCEGLLGVDAFWYGFLPLGFPSTAGGAWMDPFQDSSGNPDGSKILPPAGGPQHAPHTP